MLKIFFYIYVFRGAFKWENPMKEKDIIQIFRKYSRSYVALILNENTGIILFSLRELNVSVRISQEKGNILGPKQPSTVWQFRRERENC